MKSYTAQYDALPFVIRVIIQLMFGAIVGGIYRIVRYFEGRNTTTLAVGLLVTFTGVGNVIAWVVDLVTLVMDGRYTVLVD